MPPSSFVAGITLRRKYLKRHKDSPIEFGTLKKSKLNLLMYIRTNKELHNPLPIPLKLITLSYI